MATSEDYYRLVVWGGGAP